jgi:hypothetical protein
MKWKSILGILSIAIFLGAGCASKDSASSPESARGEKNGFIDRRSSEPPDAPENIPPPTQVHPGTEVNGMME